MRKKHQQWNNACSAGKESGERQERFQANRFSSTDKRACRARNRVLWITKKALPPCANPRKEACQGVQRVK
ncbi:hypothetical protein EWB00_001517 [Schistosoma japonicum]|uniref:Uncharacterized protein n=1 Tax=Schistosoma japonicum TaxID=6182 RepID=A0A4Z2CJX2_SCHJA|nr:hypothetical protein EWB00_001517 [Schistosoma japonicum]